MADAGTGTGTGTGTGEWYRVEMCVLESSAICRSFTHRRLGSDRWGVMTGGAVGGAGRGVAIGGDGAQVRKAPHTTHCGRESGWCNLAGCREDGMAEA